MFKWLKVCMITMVSSIAIAYTSNLKAEEKDPFVSIIDLQEERLKEERLTAQKKIELSQIVLKGIIWSNSQAVAIINDELVMTNDDWRGFKVERIDKDSITLTDQEGSYKLFFTEEAPSQDKKGLISTPELPTSELPPPENFGPLEGIIPYGERQVR